MPYAFLGIGSNIDPAENIIKAAKMLEKSVDIIAVSTHYITPALEDKKQPDYINAVWKIYTDFDYNDLKAQLGDIEHRLGRKRGKDRYAPREIDLDILLYASASPDPDIKRRDFIYTPLLEIEPDITLPGDSRPLKELVAPGKEYSKAPVTAFMKKEYPNGPEKS